MPESTNLIEKYIESNAFGKFIGMDFKILGEGLVEYFITIGPQHLATPQATHGGVISSLVDGALGVAALSAVYKENRIVSTIEFKTNFLSPSLLGDRLVAKAKVDKKGGRILIVSCDVFCENRQHVIIAKAMGTFNAYDAAKAGY